MSRCQSNCLGAVVIAGMLASGSIANGVRAQSATDASALAAKAQNPIANMISVPIQANWNFPIGPHDRTQTVINIQPVLPISIDNDWSLITRWIVPVINQPNIASNSGSTFGLGDINPSFFFATNLASDLMLGFGPTLLIPTATSTVLGNGKWGAGPTAVVVWTPKPWVIGTLVNNIWSYAGDNDRPGVNRFLVQPFVNYNLADGWYLATSPIITADWKASSQDRWIVPIGGGFGKIVHIGHQPINLLAQAYYNVVSPDSTNGPNWTLRAQVNFLFPK